MIENAHESEADEQKTDSDPDDNISLSQLKKKLPQSSVNKNNVEDTGSKTTKKMEFVLKTVGLIKCECKQSFKCTKCDDRYPTQGALNKHYWEKHEKVKCPHCPMTFSTPCTLTHHMYVHEIATKKCRCSKTFRFDSELKAHKLKHCRLPTQHCAHPNCGKSYFSASDLAKHAKIHLNITWSCQH